MPRRETCIPRDEKERYCGRQDCAQGAPCGVHPPGLGRRGCRCGRGLCRASYTIHHDPGDPWEGKTLDLPGFQDRVQQSRAAFPDQQFAVQGLFADGDTVVVTWLWHATHAGDLPGFPASGRTVRMSGATAYMFDNRDRLTGHWQITDRLGVYQQLQRNRSAAL